MEQNEFGFKGEVAPKKKMDGTLKAVIGLTVGTAVLAGGLFAASMFAGSGTSVASNLAGVPADMVLATTGVARDEVLVTVDGKSITAEELMYWIVSAADQYSQMGMTDWSMDLGGITFGEYVLEMALDTAVYHAVLENVALEVGLGMTAEDHADYAIRVEEMRMSMGEQSEADAVTSYQYWLAYMGLTEEAFDRLSHVGYYMENLQDSFFAEGGSMELTPEAVEAWAENYGIVCAKHILIADELGSEEGMATALEMATMVRDYIREDGDTENAFDNHMMTYTYDVDMYGTPNNPAGYLFDDMGYVVGTESMLVEEFTTAGAALAIGEISEPVESYYGYHVMMRVQVNVNELAEYAINDSMNAIADQWMAQADVQMKDHFETVYSMDTYDKFSVIRMDIVEGMEQTLYPNGY